MIWFTVGSYFLPTGHLAALSLGCWAAFSTARDRAGRSSPLLRDTRLAIGCGAVFLLATFVTPGGVSGELFAVLVDVAATALVLHCTLRTDSVVARLLASPVPRWIGVRSYGVYLYGLTVMQLVPILTHLPLHFAAFVDVFLTATLVAVSYRYVEAPLRTRGRRWLARRSEQQRLELDVGITGLADEHA